MLLDIQSLSHSYQNRRESKLALSSISLQVETGVLGLLGPNGAGKSSLMRILATITKPSEGNILWCGQDIIREPQALRNELGYLPQYFGVYEQLTGVEFLQYMASLKGMALGHANRVIDELLQRLNLTHAAHQSLKGYSGGMKQRIGIAQALLNDPKLLIIDEPTVGLDPQERASFKQLLSELAFDRCIILSTHIVSDIESIAERIAIMKDGHLLQSNTPEALIDTIANKCWKLSCDVQESQQCQRDHIISHSVRKGAKVELDLVSEYKPHPLATPRDANLEDAYLYFTRHLASVTPLQRAS